jgi:NitT/TauT family transport system substrate-binding protein
MKQRKRIAALGLGLVLALGLLAGCGPAAQTTPTPDPTPSPTAEATPTPEARQTVNLAMLKGPTGMGAAKLLADNEAGTTANDYQVTIAADPQELLGKLTSGELDISALPTNVAATLYNKTDGDIQIIALNTLGVLYILENGDTVQSMADLAGKTIYAPNKGSNPEYVLNYLLRENGLEPGTDVDIQWKTSDEIAALMAGGEAKLCMLPVPAATSVMMQNQEVRPALDLTEEWENVTDAGVLTMGCVVVRTAFAQEHPEAVDAFLEEYAQSIDYVKGDVEQAAQLVAQFEITPKAAIAQAAIPQANLVCITGDQVRENIQGYYHVLFQADPTSIGGSIPDDAFYYLPQ